MMRLTKDSKSLQMVEYLKEKFYPNTIVFIFQSNVGFFIFCT